jgi:hypothetical protein
MKYAGHLRSNLLKDHADHLLINTQRAQLRAQTLVVAHCKRLETYGA